MFKSLLKSLSGGEAPADHSREQAQELIAAGNAAEDAGQLPQALGLYQRATALAPQLPAAHLNLGIAQEALGDVAGARASYERVLALEPDHPFGAYNLGKLEFVQGRLQPAESLLRRALGRKPDFPQAWTVLASVLEALGDLRGAADAIARALLLQPDLAGAWGNQAGILQKLGQLDEAVESAARAARLDPSPDHLALHGHLMASAGFGAEALSLVRQAIQLAPERLDLRSRELFLLNLLDGWEPRALADRHRAWGAAMEARVAPLPARARAPGRLRVGLVSEDFRVHPVAVFLLPLLERRDRSRFEVCCYSLTERPDHVTRRIEALADRWVEAAAWTDDEVAQAIAGDGVDILLDLGGHTGRARLGIFAAKPAPVQVSWLGYLNTTGLTRIDYRLTDVRCDPPQVSQPLHTEQLLLLPHSQWCYRPFVEVEPAARAPCERNGFVTFGSFNSVTKLTDAMIARWGRILKSLPTARLLVADVASERKREAILAVIAQAGAVREQVEFAPRVSIEDYYHLMNRVDIALDSQPYGGGTTTFDTLWMGVPVVTAMGPNSASRSAASVLALLGLEDWIAPSIEQFEAIAVARANDHPAIARLRTTLRDRLRASPLMDEAGFAAAFEALLEQAWRERGAGVAQPQRALPSAGLLGQQ